MAAQYIFCPQPNTFGHTLKDKKKEKNGQNNMFNVYSDIALRKKQTKFSDFRFSLETSASKFRFRQENKRRTKGVTR